MQGNEKDEKLIVSRALDAVYSADKNYQVKHIGFLTPFQRGIILKNVFASQDVKTVFDGGYPNAERVMFVAHPEYLDFNIDDIISVIKVSGRDLNGLTHRDYLGSLMGLGITRENIGDILVDDEGAFIFVKAEISDYIMQNLDKIGRRGINKELIDCSEAVIPEPRTKEISGTVASERIDAFLAFSTGLSRAKVCEIIEKDLVSLNFEIVSSVSAKVSEGDLISVRGYGRIRVKKIGGLTRKGRISVKADKFE